MYGGGRTVDRRISVGESSEEWLMTRSTVGAMRMVNWEREYRRLGCIVGVFKIDWGCGRWVVGVYK